MVAGLVLGGAIGAAVVVLVVALKPTFLVDTPRAVHGVLIVLMVGVPALAGAVVGALGRRSG